MPNEERESEDPLKDIARELKKLNRNIEKLIREDHCTGQTYFQTEMSLDAKLRDIFYRTYVDK